MYARYNERISQRRNEEGNECYTEKENSRFRNHRMFKQFVLQLGCMSREHLRVQLAELEIVETIENFP